MADEFPPLKIRSTSGTPTVMPAFTVSFSGGTLTRTGPTSVQIMVDSGGGGVPTSRQILTTAPLAGGGDFTADRTHTLDTAAVVTSGRSVSTLYPLAGGGNLSANRTLSVDSAFFVTTARQILTTAPLAGGGDFTVDRTHTIDTAAMVTSGRTISTLYPLSGGANFSANRTFTVDTAFLVNSGRVINTGSGILGGQALNSDLTIYLNVPLNVAFGGIGSTGNFNTFGVLLGSAQNPIMATASPGSGQILVGSGVNMPPFFFKAGSDGQYMVAQSGQLGGFLWAATVAGGGSTVVYAPTGATYLMTTGSSPPFTGARIMDISSGLTATDLGAANSLSVSVNTNVRDKIFTFFGAGACSTAMFVSSARVYIPYSMQPVGAYLVMMNSAVTFGVTANIYVYASVTGPYASLFTSSADIPMLAANAYANTGTITFGGGVMGVGSFLGINIIQVGTVTAPGSNITLTLVCRTS